MAKNSWEMLGTTFDQGRNYFGGSNENPVIANSPGIGTGPEKVAPQYVPGLGQGRPIAGDFNMQGPGAAESAYNAYMPSYQAPGAGMQWWQQNQGQFGQPGASEDYFQNTRQQYQDPTNAQGYYSDWNDKSEGLSADMAPYYDRAKERSTADLDKAFAARGMFGSSASTDAVGQAVTDLEAQRAKDEAQYGLERAAEQRAWSGLGGTLASAADSSNLGYLTAGQGAASDAQNAQLARLLGAGGMAQGFDAGQLNRMNAGMNAAGLAQGARRQRVQDMFQNVSTPGSMLFEMDQGYYPAMMGNDQQLMDSSLLFGTGLAQDMVNSDRYATEKWRDDDRHAMDMWGSLKGGFAGGGMGG